MVGRREARPGLDDRRRDAEPGIDLGQLAAGRAAAEDDAGSRGSSRASVASRFVQVGTSSRPSIGGRLETEPTATTMFVPASSWVDVVVAGPRPGHGRRSSPLPR